LYYRLTIPYILPGLNEYIGIERQNKYAAAQVKKNIESGIIFLIKQQLPQLSIKEPIVIDYTWIEPNKRRDKDNIAFAKKFIQDALVKAGVLNNDGWDFVADFSDKFRIDAENPGVMVIIHPLCNETKAKFSSALTKTSFF